MLYDGRVLFLTKKHLDSASQSVDNNVIDVSNSVTYCDRIQTIGLYNVVTGDVIPYVQ